MWLFSLETDVLKPSHHEVVKSLSHGMLQGMLLIRLPAREQNSSLAMSAQLLRGPSTSECIADPEKSLGLLGGRRLGLLGGRRLGEVQVGRQRRLVGLLLCSTTS